MLDMLVINHESGVGLAWSILISLFRAREMDVLPTVYLPSRKWIRPEFFYFSFYRLSRPNFLKIKFFFSILFLYFPPTHATTVLKFKYMYVFSFSLFYCSKID